MVALPCARRRDYLAFIWALVLGRDPATNSRALSFTCMELTLTGEEGFPIQADGDIVAACPADFAICRNPVHFR